MKKIFSQLFIAIAVLTLTVVFSFAIEPVLPSAKDAAKATVATKQAKAGAKVNTAKAAVASKQLDINTATEAQLKAVPGIGEAYAAKIIAGRPYAKKDQLKTRKILSGPAYDQVKDHIIAKQAVKPTPKNK